MNPKPKQKHLKVQSSLLHQRAWFFPPAPVYMWFKFPLGLKFSWAALAEATQMALLAVHLDGKDKGPQSLQRSMALYQWQLLHGLQLAASC